MNKSMLTAPLVAAALVFGSAGIATAQNPATPPTGAATQQATNADQIRDRLEAQGYSDVRDINMDEGMWKAKATNAAGDKTKLRLDANGNVVSEESWDKDKKDKKESRDY